MENEDSVNLPTRFYDKKCWHRGWINIVNPFRASMVLGTPGRGKSYTIVNNYIKQQIEKGFAMYIYDGNGRSLLGRRYHIASYCLTSRIFFT